MTAVICTLVFLRRDGRLLLGMKKRGFGAGNWNGVGGKVDPGETIEQAMIRECQEEIGVTPIAYDKAAEHTFYIRYNDRAEHMLVHAYLCREWDGTPVETDEIRPEWFAEPAIPYDTMWADDIHWLPRVLAGQKLRGEYWFDNTNRLTKHRIEEVAAL